jgi:predicted DCC family thiol-disulfide oxidoreductase YuxK
MSGHAIILFDGHCLLCSGWVRRIHRRDQAARFRFAAQQSPAGRRLLRGMGLDETIEGVVVQTPDGQPLTHTDAVLYVGQRIGQPWALLAGTGRWVPKPIREAAYRWLARRRYRLFGRSETCMMPEDGLRERFVEGGAEEAIPVEADASGGPSVASGPR